MLVSIYSDLSNYLSYFRTTNKTDADIVKDNHQFVWDDEDESDSWDKRLAKNYYDKLYKEYCVADLSRYKENKVVCGCTDLTIYLFENH